MAVRWLLWLSLLAACCLPACLPTELTDAQLVNWCAADKDCAAKDTYACLQATCVANQCAATGSVVTPHTACHTAACATGCICSAPKDAPGKPGVCFSP